VVDQLDRTVSPRADAFVRTSLFADGVAAMIRLEAQVRRRAERQTSRLWHMWNLPTATDIRRVRSQLASVEARLRDLSERVEESEQARRDTEPTRGDRHTPTKPTGGAKTGSAG
jgi:CRISPR/Cas system Type II protein with McrA/HNH and RuvC-like nuclease domain